MIDKKKEPELFKAVKYALDEYPCLLNALQNGTLDFSSRINKTAKDELVNLLEHKWQPMPAMALA